MPLTLTVLRCPNAVAPETRTISGGEFTVGRGPGVDWVLPDPERLLSKHHFAVAYRAGAWQIADTSTNGTTINADPEPIGRGQVRTLRDGDRLKLGAYEIEVRVAEEAAPSAGNCGFGFAGGPAPAPSPFDDPFGGDPFAPPPPPPTPFGDPAYPSAPLPGAAQLPADFDPLAPDPAEEPFRGTQSDHSPLMEDAFRPPAVSGQMPLHTGGALPGEDLLPDDWDKDLLEGIAPPRPVPANPSLPPAPPGARAAPPRPAPQPHRGPPAAATGRAVRRWTRRRRWPRRHGRRLRRHWTPAAAAFDRHQPAPHRRRRTSPRPPAGSTVVAVPSSAPGNPFDEPFDLASGRRRRPAQPARGSPNPGGAAGAARPAAAASRRA